MVMGQFLTTYRKDFLWPYVTTLGFKPESEHSSHSHKLNECRCHALNDVRPTSMQIIGPGAHKDDQWSRLGPMGPLLEPKMFGAKTGSAPETEISKYNQPNVFMRKLKEKYPFIYECLKNAPPDDLISRINKERLSTTYQVDYCKKREYPTGPYDELLAAAGVEGLPPCPEPVKIPGDICKPRGKVSAKKDSSFTTNLKFENKKSKEPPLGSCKGGVFSVTPKNTEYQDTHSRLGNLIIRDGIHDPSRRKAFGSAS
ncbi:unnamed protein product [Psylliodes chrysocephalus]|uniref:Uncharacterized protein n=1 Tax=Psylliodes chrysocephalus TaxID=3402493 RepID=A0A9P0CVV3_9CUCU|nr:unnamed protein product [Psylliodes chrysocephala]